MNLYFDLSLHRREELGVCLGLAEAFEDNFHLFDGRQWVEHPTHDPDPVEVFFADKQFLLAGSGPLQVDGREQTLIGESAVEVDLTVTSSLELLEDNIVHSGSGVDQRSCNDRERSAFLNVSG